ncbi:VapE domain-containing protein [Spirosoma daeguense]
MNAKIANRVISLYKNAYQKESYDEITITNFLEGVAIGRWRKEVERVRAAKYNKEKYNQLKKTAPAVTLAGTFNQRNTKSIRDFSGLMAIDLDHLGPESEGVINILKSDPYVLAVFRSIGGDGLCVIFQISPDRWLESFEGIRIYLTDTYGLITGWDESVKDICRLRFVSYDPDTYINYQAKLFNKYPRKEKNQPKKEGFVHTEKNIQYIVDQINQRAIDIAPDYNAWYRVCWSLISQYGVNALDLFQQISQHNDDYNSVEVEKKFNYLVKTQPQKITIGTFYYYCKLAGIDIMTPETREIVGKAVASKRNKVTIESCLKTAIELMGSTEEFAKPIIEQVYASNESFDIQETLFDQIADFLKMNYSIRYNEVKRDFEDDNGNPLEDYHYNAMYFNIKRALGDSVRFDDMYRIIHSRVVCESFNPFTSFFKRYKQRGQTGNIQALANTIASDTGLGSSDFESTHVYRFLRKWLIGLIGSIYGKPCDLVLVLTGGDGIGKTWFFRYLLPEEWQAYAYDSKWSADKDEYIDMCKHILAINDEFKGRDTKDMEHFKAITSKQYFNVREVYAKKSVKLPRLAVLCATSNHKGIICEPEYNRRIIPINVLSINHEAYNSIDKIDLIMEAYHAYHAGEQSTLTKEERILLGSQTEEFQNKSVERQLIEQYLQVPTGNGGEQVQFMSTMDILAKLELKLNNRRLDDRKMGRELNACGFTRKQKRIDHSKRAWGYDVVLLESTVTNVTQKSL